MKILLSKYKIFLPIYLAFFIFVIIICSVRTKYETTTTGDTDNLNSTFNVDNSNSINGSYNSIFVWSQERVSLFQKWLVSLDKEALIEKGSDNYNKFSDADYQRMGIIQRNQSYEASIITAYNEAAKLDSNIHIDYTYQGVIVNYKIYEGKNLEIGDIIISVNDISKDNYDDFINELKTNYMIGTKLKLIRNNKELEVTVSDESDGFSYYDKYNIDFSTITPRLTISKSNSLGPSGGLLQTLSLYDKLTSNDICRGRKITGTGTINTNGKVGMIGGICQKVIAAKKSKCDIFLCPEDNYEEGYNQYKKLRKTKMKFVKVSSFSEALEVLNNV